jgi:hypothetical protein
MSFAKKHIEDGNYEEAVAAASAEIDAGDAGPEPLFDRATAFELLERYAEAVSDLELALEKNRTEKELDPFVLDDAYFSATLSLARSEVRRDLATAVTTLARYRQFAPDGAHHAESRQWELRLRGELPSLLDKTKSVDAG